MALTEMAFTPATGFRDATAYPNPANGTEWRDQLQDGLDQIRDYINDDLIDELADTGGANEIGYDNGYATVGDALDAVLAAGTGSIPPDNTITTAKLVDGNVTTNKLAADAVDGTKIADDAVDTEHIADGAVETDQLGAKAVTAAKIADNTLSESQMATAYKKAAGGIAEYDTVNTHVGHTVSNSVHGLDATVAKFKNSNSTYTDDDNSQTFTDAFCSTNSLVLVQITSATAPQGAWTVTPGNGSFTIASSAAESADITFDYYIIKVV